MRIEHGDDGALVFGYLDTVATAGNRASDAVLVRAEGSGRARSYRLGEVGACEISGDHGMSVVSRVSPAARYRGHALGLLMDGRGALEQDGRRASLAPGDFVLYSGERPFRLHLGAHHRYLLLGLPEHSVPPECAGRITADPELSRLPSGRILTAMLTETTRLADRLGPVARWEMGEHLTAVLRTLIRESGHGGTAPDHRAALLDRVLDHIDRHLGEELSPESIAAAHHVSVRSLHALFRSQGETVNGYVRGRRLDRVRRDLAAPDLMRLPVYAVAARWGIRDASHLSRLFRARFGVSPRRFRQQALEADPAPARDGGAGRDRAGGSALRQNG
ncbi:helix-turn-helix domain-containing protein [Nocardiopsis sp. EMB25]|uniref:helix-turn-helix domain-containing protein n=1 Tax=Nocardiopsis sp. EMB25 TaxID=2835867 RepID=UPI0022836BCE|nr:helix-turn-helix domain-containing protein [Nocardiopsis sp. EMB25]MCY9784248.1 helix-turn-helix domain-containing protein [Nocardiopsis sp. EMB25]